MPEQHAVVAVYENHAQAEVAVRQLQQAGVEMTGVSVIAGVAERASGLYTRGGEVRHHGEHHRLWGFLSGLLADTGTFSIPGAGPIMVAGPAVGWLAEAVDDVEGDDASAVTRSLAGSGIPSGDVPRFEAALRAGRWLVIVHGPDESIRQAAAVAAATQALDTATYSVV